MAHALAMVGGSVVILLAGDPLAAPPVALAMRISVSADQRKERQ